MDDERTLVAILVGAVNVAAVATSSRSLGSIVHLLEVEVHIALCFAALVLCPNDRIEQVAMTWSRLRMVVKVICLVLFSWLAVRLYLMRMVVVGFLSWRGYVQLSKIKRPMATRMVLSTQKGPKSASKGREQSHAQSWVESIVGSIQKLTPQMSSQKHPTHQTTEGEEEVGGVSALLRSIRTLGSAVLSSAKSKVSGTSGGSDSQPVTPAITKRLFSRGSGSGSDSAPGSASGSAHDNGRSGSEAQDGDMSAAVTPASVAGSENGSTSGSVSGSGSRSALSSSLRAVGTGSVRHRTSVQVHKLTYSGTIAVAVLVTGVQGYRGDRGTLVDP
jgi:hypothetical protein